MSEPTRRDRELALEVVYGKNWRDSPWACTREAREHFLEIGDEGTLPGSPSLVAYGIARGREEGYAACQADVVARIYQERESRDGDEFDEAVDVALYELSKIIKSGKYVGADSKGVNHD